MAVSGPRRGLLARIFGQPAPAALDLDPTEYFTPRDKPKGWSGTKLQGGRIRDEEPNADLVGRDAARVAMNMVRQDDAAQAAWEAVSATLQSASWAWKAGRPSDPFSMELADQANSMMGLDGKPGRMARSWEDVVGELILHELVGFRYAEPLWEFRTGHGYDLVDVADRDPRVHRLWETDGRCLTAVVQDPPQEQGVRLEDAPRIPADCLLLLTRGGTGHNFEGRGLFRGAYFPVKLKAHVLDMVSVGAERWGFATPKLKAKRSEAAAAMADYDFDAQLDNARANLAAYLAQEASYLEEPEFVEFLTYGGDVDPRGLLEVVAYCDTAILRCFLVQFLAIGVTDTGSRAAGQVHESFFRRAAINVLDRIAAGMGGADRPGGGVIGRWVTFNHGPNVDPALLPVLTHTGLDVDRLQQLIPSLAALTSTGWAVPDQRARDVLRARGGLPPEELNAEELKEDPADVV